MEDHSERLRSDLRCAALPAHLRGLTPQVKVTEANKRVLAKYDGCKLEYVSNPLVYADVFRHISKVEHKMLLRLFLAGHVRVFRFEGALGTPAIGGNACFHYQVRVT